MSASSRYICECVFQVYLCVARVLRSTHINRVVGRVLSYLPGIYVCSARESSSTAAHVLNVAHVTLTSAAVSLTAAQVVLTSMDTHLK